MKIQLFDEKGNSLGEESFDLEQILEQAERNAGDTFAEGVGILKRSIQHEFSGYEVTASNDSDIEKALRQFAALGQAKGLLTIKLLKRKEDHQDMMIQSKAFEEVIKLSDPSIKQRYDRLVGLDNLKTKISKEASIMLAPDKLDEWSEKHHQVKVQALQTFHDRYPFFIFEGDVGTGKTEFAETFGNEVVSIIKKDALLARVSMKSRGEGVVGQMSKLISEVFKEADELASKYKSPVIVLLDEADSLAQSREENQMHHEDRAGVNALIQGIDKIRESRYRVMVVFCTNRLQAIDPALKRRAALIHTFTRPNVEQRMQVFRNFLADLNLTQNELSELVRLTGETNRGYGFTYSDLITRLIPNSVLAAFPDKPLSYAILLETVRSTQPTPPFNEASN